MLMLVNPSFFLFLFWRKYHFSPYILGLQSTWSLHFNSNQFGLRYFQVTINLALIFNSLTKNVTMKNGCIVGAHMENIII